MGCPRGPRAPAAFIFVPGRHVPGRAPRGDAPRPHGGGGSAESLLAPRSRAAPGCGDGAPRVPGSLGLPEATPVPGRRACSGYGGGGGAGGAGVPGRGGRPGSGVVQRLNVPRAGAPRGRCRGVGRRDGGASPLPGSGLPGGDGCGGGGVYAQGHSPGSCDVGAKLRGNPTLWTSARPGLAGASVTLHLRRVWVCGPAPSQGGPRCLPVAFLGNVCAFKWG